MTKMKSKSTGATISQLNKLRNWMRPQNLQFRSTTREMISTRIQLGSFRLTKKWESLKSMTARYRSMIFRICNTSS